MQVRKYTRISQPASPRMPLLLAFAHPRIHPHRAAQVSRIFFWENGIACAVDGIHPTDHGFSGVGFPQRRLMSYEDIEWVRRPICQIAEGIIQSGHRLRPEQYPEGHLLCFARLHVGFVINLSVDMVCGWGKVLPGGCCVSPGSWPVSVHREISSHISLPVQMIRPCGGEIVLFFNNWYETVNGFRDPFCGTT